MADILRPDPVFLAALERKREISHELKAIHPGTYEEFDELPIMAMAKYKNLINEYWELKKSYDV